MVCYHLLPTFIFYWRYIFAHIFIGCCVEIATGSLCEKLAYIYLMCSCAESCYSCLKKYGILFQIHRNKIWNELEWVLSIIPFIPIIFDDLLRSLVEFLPFIFGEDFFQRSFIFTLFVIYIQQSISKVTTVTDHLKIL